ncbi:Tripartite DNA replication factor [Apophysomyces sp. BC1021]|nr:Tripartite DNA replication factor [Apophysomyces sp. BC1021]
MEDLNSKKDDASRDLPTFTVSGLAKNALLKCDKYVKLSGYRTYEMRSIRTSSRKGELNQAHCKRGVLFEEELLAQLGDSVVDHTNTPGSDVKRVLRDCKPGQVLYQLPCEMPESFYEDEGIGMNVYRISKFIPDFLWIKEDPSSNKRIIFVVDAKSSSVVAPPHQFQVATYAYLLDYIVRGLRGIEIDVMGGVALPSKTDEINIQTFRVDLAIPKVRYFYTKALGAILANPNPKWLFNANCKTCDYVEICKKETAGNPGIIPYMTSQKLSRIACNDEGDIENLTQSLNALGLQEPKTTVTVDDLAQELNAVSLSSTDVYLNLPEYKPFLDAYNTGKPQFLGNATIMTARNTTHDIFISMIIDPIYRQPCAYAIQTCDSKTGLTIPKGYMESSASSPQTKKSLWEGYTKLVVSFIVDLEKILEQMVGLRCTIFVYQQQMKGSIQKCLVDLVSTGAEMVEPAEMRDEICRKAMRCLLVLFQDTQLLSISSVDSFPMNDSTDSCSVVGRIAVMDQLLQENIALGISGFYSLKDVVSWMVGNDAEVVEEDDLYSAWKDEADLSSRYKKHLTLLRLILQRYRSMAEEYQAQCEEEQFPLDCAPFQWAKTQLFPSPVLARLAFFKRMECLANCDQVRMQRLDDFKSLSQYNRTPLHGILLAFSNYQEMFSPVQHRKSICGRFEVVQERFRPPVQIQVDTLSINNMAEYFIVPDNREGILQAIRYPDMAYRTEIRKPGITTMNIRSQRFRLYPRFIDHTTNKVLDAFSRMGKEKDNENIFVQLLKNPNSWASQEVQNEISTDVKAAALKLQDEFAMSQSQKETGAKAIQRRLQIVWGPPGSGKTEFLARFTNWFLSYLQAPADDRQRPFIIAVTAFTRLAITNLLKRIASVQDTYSSERLFEIVSLETTPKSMRSDALECKAEKLEKVVETFRKKGVTTLVVGGTVWDWNKVKGCWPDWSGSDMMIIDEGSQQLGPIIRNKYPQQPLHEPLLFGSIQQALMRTEKNRSISIDEFVLRRGETHDFGPNTIQLKDNWRMNRELNQFFQQIYGDDYTARFPKIQLRYNKTKFEAEQKEIQAALNPDKSVTMLEIQLHTGKDVALDWAETAAETETEAEVVAQLVNAHISARVDSPGLKNAAADRHVMVVTPHHRQRVAIQQRLGRLGHYNVTVDTVEKLQGQECELVIACFALRDVMRHMDFLLDFRRWNVAISRARCKVIVVTTSDLLSRKDIHENGFDLFAKRDSAEGWEFINMLQQWAERTDAIITWSSQYDSEKTEEDG